MSTYSQEGEGWIVRREGAKKTFKFFENKEDAIEYASIITLIS